MNPIHRNAIPDYRRVFLTMKEHEKKIMRKVWDNGFSSVSAQEVSCLIKLRIVERVDNGKLQFNRFAKRIFETMLQESELCHGRRL